MVTDRGVLDGGEFCFVVLEKLINCLCPGLEGSTIDEVKDSKYI